MRTRSSTAINGHLANAYLRFTGTGNALRGPFQPRTHCSAQAGAPSQPLRFTARVTPCVDRFHPDLIAPLKPQSPDLPRRAGLERFSAGRFPCG